MTTPSDGIWIIDPHACTLFANAAMAEILGTDLANLLGKQSFDYVFPEDAPAAQRLFEAKINGDKAPFHFKLRRQDGTPIWVDIQGTPMHSVDGQFMGIVGTFRISAKQS